MVYKRYNNYWKTWNGRYFAPYKGHNIYVNIRKKDLQKLSLYNSLRRLFFRCNMSFVSLLTYRLNLFWQLTLKRKLDDKILRKHLELIVTVHPTLWEQAFNIFVAKQTQNQIEEISSSAVTPTTQEEVVQFIRASPRWSI